jgi:hypothetical protein
VAPQVQASRFLKWRKSTSMPKRILAVLSEFGNRSEELFGSSEIFDAQGYEVDFVTNPDSYMTGQKIVEVIENGLTRYGG